MTRRMLTGGFYPFPTRGRGPAELAAAAAAAKAQARKVDVVCLVRCRDEDKRRVAVWQGTYWDTLCPSTGVPGRAEQWTWLPLDEVTVREGAGGSAVVTMSAAMAAGLGLTTTEDGKP